MQGEGSEEFMVLGQRRPATWAHSTVGHGGSYHANKMLRCRLGGLVVNALGEKSNLKIKCVQPVTVDNTFTPVAS